MLRLDWPVKENEIDDSSALEVDLSTTAMAAFGIATFAFLVLLDIMSNRFELFDEDFANSGPHDDGWLIQ